MQFDSIFTEEKMQELFPADRADAFFDALYGDAEDGAYDISVGFVGANESGLEFSFNLTQRPGKCLACNLTYGLPQVFMRHPIINLKGFAEAVATAADKDPASVKWELGRTKEHSRNLHSIPLTIAF